MCGEMALKTRDFAACRSRDKYMFVEAERLPHSTSMSGLGNRERGWSQLTAIWHFLSHVNVMLLLFLNAF
jgi:hypothetical protein